MIYSTSKTPESILRPLERLYNRFGPLGATLIRPEGVRPLEIVKKGLVEHSGMLSVTLSCKTASSSVWHTERNVTATDDTTMYIGFSLSLLEATTTVSKKSIIGWCSRPVLPRLLFLLQQSTI